MQDVLISFQRRTFAGRFSYSWRVHFSSGLSFHTFLQEAHKRMHNEEIVSFLLYVRFIRGPFAKFVDSPYYSE